MLILLVPLFGVFFLGFGIGQVEIALWLILASAWVWAFIFWATREPPSTQ